MSPGDVSRCPPDPLKQRVVRLNRQAVRAHALAGQLGLVTESFRVAPWFLHTGASAQRSWRVRSLQKWKRLLVDHARRAYVIYCRWGLRRRLHCTRHTRRLSARNPTVPA